MDERDYDYGQQPQNGCDPDYQDYNYDYSQYGGDGTWDPNAGYDYSQQGYSQQPYQQYADFQNYYGEQTYSDGEGYQDQTPEEPPRKRKRSIVPIITGIIFYLLLAGAGTLFYFHSEDNLMEVEGQLQAYEQAQPVYVCQSVFDQLFKTPDWAALYDMAGLQDSTYEGKDAFAAYMTQKVGATALTFQQLTFRPDEPLTYGVYLGEEKIGSFTMEDKSTDPQSPDWQLGEVALYYQPMLHYTISTPAGCQVSINGVALDESHRIQESYMETLDEKKIKLPGAQVLEIRDLLVKPEVTVSDAQGNPLEVSFDETKGLFSVPLSAAATVGQQEKEIALNALNNYCEFMINKGGGRKNLQKYFLADTDTYDAIVGSDLTWVQKERDHGYVNEQVTDYVKYSDTSFSVRASFTWQLTRPDGSVKESLVEQSMFFENMDGKWLCTRMTGLPLTREVSTVRVSFLEGDTVLDTQMVEAGTDLLQCPKVSVPEGKTFGGWMMEKEDADGSLYYQRVLIPDGEGKAKLPGSMLPLKPLRLFPVFLSQDQAGQEAAATPVSQAPAE